MFVLCVSQVTRQYQCARLTGLDSCDGVLLLGSTHFYVIEGFTLTKMGDVVDMETVARESVVYFCVTFDL